MFTLDEGNVEVLGLGNELAVDDELAVRSAVDDNKSEAHVTVCVVARGLRRAVGTTAVGTITC